MFHIITEDAEINWVSSFIIYYRGKTRIYNIFRNIIVS